MRSRQTKSVPQRPPRPWRRVVVYSLIVIVTVTAAVLFWEGRTDRERARALALAEAKRFDEAEPILIRIFERDPNDLTVTVALATGHLSSDRLVADAEPYLTRWCTLEPSNPAPFKLRMDLWQRLKRQDRALADGLHILKLDPTDNALRQTVAWLLVAEGRYTEADAACEVCRKVAPDNPHLQYLKAYVAYVQGEFHSARVWLDSMVKVQQDYAPAALLRATIYLEQEPPQPDMAVPLLRNAIAGNLDAEDRQKARYLLSQALTRLGQDEEARKFADELRKERDADRLAIDATQQPGNLALQVRAATALLDAGRKQEGMAMLDRVFQGDANHAGAHTVLADYYEKQGRHDLANDHRKRAKIVGTPTRAP